MSDNENNNNIDSENDSNKMLYISFNQNCSCFAIGTESGFTIYSTFPYKDKFTRTLNGGIGIVEMLNSSNILALVGGGKCPKYNKNKVIVWDDYQQIVISELKFTNSIKNVKLKNDKIFIILEKKIFVFNLETYENIETIDTCENPKGLIGINNDQNFTVIVYPISTGENNFKGICKIKFYENEKEVIVKAHESQINYLQINFDGTILAVACDMGKIIRIFRTIDGQFLNEFKRGKEKAEINYMCFEQKGNFLAITSDRKTIHIWSMGSSIKKSKEIKIKAQQNNNNNINNNNINNNNDNNNNINKVEEKDKNKNNNGKKIDELPENDTGFFKHFGFDKSEYSFAKVRLNEEQKSICAFVPENKLIIVTSNGMYYQAQIDIKKGGDCKIVFTADLNKEIKDK